MAPTTASKDETEASHRSPIQKKKPTNLTKIGAFASIEEFSKVGKI